LIRLTERTPMEGELNGDSNGGLSGDNDEWDWWGQLGRSDGPYQDQLRRVPDRPKGNRHGDPRLSFSEDDEQRWCGGVMRNWDGKKGHFPPSSLSLIPKLNWHGKVKRWDGWITLRLRWEAGWGRKGEDLIPLDTWETSFIQKMIPKTRDQSRPKGESDGFTKTSQKETHPERIPLARKGTHY